MPEPKRSDGSPNYRVVARAADKTAELYLYDDIGGGFFGGITAKQVIDDLAELGSRDQIVVRINSPGGEVFEGWAIYAALKRNPANIRVEIDGIAASIASCIAMAGDEINIADNAMVMIHNPVAMAMGTSQDLRSRADMLDQVRGNMLKTYSERTGNDQARLQAWCDAETWMDATEAVENGFADAKTEALAMAAAADREWFRTVPPKLSAGRIVRPRAGMRAPALSEMRRIAASKT